ncbi:hypothetical protein H4R24_001149 [Coemansia sp. RSA 988]|nr:hypothetical protein H4R24_001149 [Coemansia sp. RSA 988]
MVRVSTLLATSFLVFWISVLGSTGSLIQGWRTSPKALAPRALELLLWTRFTRHELSSSNTHAIRIAQDMSYSNDTNTCDDAQAWHAYPALPCPKASRAAHPSHILSTEQPLEILERKKATKRRNRRACFDANQSSSCSNEGGRADAQQPIADSTRTLETWVNVDSPQIRPMSSLLYHRRPTPTPAVGYLDVAAQKSKLHITDITVALSPRLDDMDLGKCMYHRTENNSALLESFPTSKAHWLSEPCSNLRHVPDGSGAQYRKRALALRRASGQASRTLVAPEELTASAILPEEPNGVTSMIAISTVLVFATLGAF